MSESNQNQLIQEQQNERLRVKLAHTFQKYGPCAKFLLDVYNYQEKTIRGFDKEYLLEDFCPKGETCVESMNKCKKNIKKANSKPKWVSKTRKVKSAYNYYVMEQNQKWKDENKSLSFNERSKGLSDGWNKIKGTRKCKKYEDMNSQDRERYNQELEAEKEQAIADGLLQPKDDKPKKAMNGYFFYSNKCRSKVSEEIGLSGVEVNKELGSRWRSMSDDEKEPWLKMSMEDKERYKSELKVYMDRKAMENMSDDEVVVGEQDALLNQVIDSERDVDSQQVGNHEPQQLVVESDHEPVAEPDPEPKPVKKELKIKKKRRRRRVHNNK
tara:strand:+ start:102 stop:1079 length:978 start_codon:yes stop_codon:yes gene_type:complete